MKTTSIILGMLCRICAAFAIARPAFGYNPSESLFHIECVAYAIFFLLAAWDNEKRA